MDSCSPVGAGGSAGGDPEEHRELRGSGVEGTLGGEQCVSVCMSFAKHFENLRGERHFRVQSLFWVVVGMGVPQGIHSSLPLPPKKGDNGQGGGSWCTGGEGSQGAPHPQGSGEAKVGYPCRVRGTGVMCCPSCTHFHTDRLHGVGF